MFNKLNNAGLVYFPGYEGCFFGKTINADFMKPGQNYTFLVENPVDSKQILLIIWKVDF